MQVRHVWLTDFRNYEQAELPLADGLTVVLGGNGEGKSNLLEALAYLATLSSFRGAPPEALVRHGASRAAVRASVQQAERELLVEAEVVPGGRSRTQINRQPLRRARDLLGALRVTVFAPDDLALVKGGPAERRRCLDETLVALHPRNDALRADVDRCLRQRNALLRQSGGRLTPDVEATLDVWDARLGEAGETLARARLDLVERLSPVLAESYAGLAASDGGRTAAVAAYRPSWGEEGLTAALRTARPEELRRGLTLVGPHRDELALTIGAAPARTHASQGEQRSLALALRLAAHAVVTETAGAPPVLLLDDVFSELDPGRARALLERLPTGQTLLTTAGALPSGAHPDRVVQIAGGKVVT